MPRPMATPDAWNAQVVSPWTTQGYSNTPTAPLWDTLTFTNNTQSYVLPQVFTSNSTSVNNYRCYVSSNTLTMVFPEEWAQRQDDGWHNLPTGSGALNAWRAEPEPVPNPFAGETAEETAARMRREQAAAQEAAAAHCARAEARRRERAEADARAEALLQLFLSPEQAEEYGREQAVTVRAPSGRRYRLRRMLSGGVQELDAEGKVRATLCIHPVEDCPTADMLICQLHMIQADEVEFRRIANHRRVA